MIWYATCLDCSRGERFTDHGRASDWADEHAADVGHIVDVTGRVVPYFSLDDDSPAQRMIFSAN